MPNSPWLGCEELLLQAYTEARRSYSGIYLGVEIYFTRLVSIIRKYLGAGPEKLEAMGFLSKIHTKDLYLTTACAEGNEAAWQQFVGTCRNFVYGSANHECRNVADADELASNIIADLFMPGRSNRPRIASYEGQCSLLSWLRVFISNRAINERERKWNSVESLECLSDVADESIMERMEASVRASKYRLIILNSFKGASDGLDEQDQHILLMIYDEAMQAKDVARHLGVHPSGVTRRLRHIHKAIRQEVIAILEKHQLSEAAIAECIVDILENPEHSLLEHVKAGYKQSAAVPKTGPVM